LVDDCGVSQFMLSLRLRACRYTPPNLSNHVLEEDAGLANDLSHPLAMARPNRAEGSRRGGIAALIAGGVAFAVSESLPKEYDSQARVLVGSLTATSTDALDAYQRLA
jgi:hypothetical protein